MKRALLAGLCLSLVGAVSAAPAGGKWHGRVAVLKSEESLQTLGWRGRWEWQGAVRALRTMGLAVETVTPANLGRCKSRLLILPNCRNLDLRTVEAVRKHVDRGGRLLATYQTSFRKADNTPWNPSNFALSRQLGVRYKRWSGSPAEAGQMTWAEGEPTTLPRHQAMIVEPLEQTKILAVWDRPEKSPAAVMGEGGLYLGEDLLAPEISGSPEVRQRLCVLLRRLDPGLTPEPGPALPLDAPNPPFVAFQGSSAPIRVGLGTFPSGLRVRSHTGALLGHAGREVVLSATPERVVLHASDGHHQEAPQMTVEGQDYLDVWTELPNHTYRWQAFRGRLEAQATPEGLALVNVLPLEAYLAGVVPSEVPLTFPGEALKAMAVVARTYTMSHLARHKGYDLCSEVHCQVYRGLAQEASTTTEAVFATGGEFVYFAGKPADTSFSACCGGQGVSVEAAWPRYSPVPYLVGLADTDAATPDLSLEDSFRQWLDRRPGLDAGPPLPAPPPPAFCSEATRFRWEETLRWKDVQERFAQALPVLLGTSYQAVGEITNVTVVARDRSGRVKEMRVDGTAGNCTIGHDAVRWLTSAGKIGAGGLNSSLFYLDSLGQGEERQLRFRGAGWGHGVGMCQEGAAGRARAGQDYRRILEHYYPGTQLAREPEVAPTPVP